MIVEVKINYAEVELLDLAMESIFKKMDAGTNLTLLRFAALSLGDKIKPLYVEYVKKSNEILFKHIEMDGGKPKESKIVDISGEKSNDKFIWKNNKSKDIFNKELDEFRLKENTLLINKYDANLLIEQPLKMSDTNYITILKYIAL